MGGFFLVPVTRRQASGLINPFTKLKVGCYIKLLISYEPSYLNHVTSNAISSTRRRRCRPKEQHHTDMINVAISPIAVVN